jgi:hypothetical protein
MGRMIARLARIPLSSLLYPCAASWEAAKAAKITSQHSIRCGAIAQLGERIVRNDEVVGSIPTSSTKFSITCGACRGFFS